jgi:hypothetical protein
MTIQGIILLDLIGFVLLLWILDQVRRDRLYVGYGVIFVLTVLGAILILSLPPLLALVTKLLGAVFPVSALTLLALCFMVFMLVYVLTQITLLSNRLATVTQQLAIQQAKGQTARLARQGGHGAAGGESSAK